MISIESLLKKLNENPDRIEFDEVINAIDEHYDFAPTKFVNGTLSNEAGQNSGSCKIFSFGLLHNLSPEQTLACFGTYYRNDVLNHPERSDHGNIRNFMQFGWNGIEFTSPALKDRFLAK